MAGDTAGNYEKAHAVAQADPRGFEPRLPRVLTGSSAGTRCWTIHASWFYRWFTGGVLNTCYSCVDRYVENGRGNQAALVFDSPLADSRREITFRELQELARISHTH